MSLKSFHVAFVAVCVLMFVFMAFYAISEMTGAMGMILALVSAVLAVGAVVYGRLFLRKMKSMEAAL
jgi:hypothetical protein